MIVLTAIGRFFKKIWDWIKQTAWIQPLLIVGIIFGVIFSIPSIVKAAKNGKAERAKAEKYYHNFQISLEYEGGEEVSPADKFTTKLENVMLNSDANAVADFKNSYPELGDKFFVSYVAQTCEKCEAAKPGFELFQEMKDNSKEGDFFYTKEDGNAKFNMITIFSDEETSYTSEDETAFVQYLSRHTTFFEEVGSNAYNTDYFMNGKLQLTDLEALETADPQDFLTPTIFLVELGDSVLNKGVTEVMFGVDGENTKAKAETLLDCWKHTGDFSVNE